MVERTVTINIKINFDDEEAMARIKRLKSALDKNTAQPKELQELNVRFDTSNHSLYLQEVIKHREVLRSISRELKNASLSQQDYNRYISAMSPDLQRAVADANRLGKEIRELGDAQHETRTKSEIAGYAFGEFIGNLASNAVQFAISKLSEIPSVLVNLTKNFADTGSQIYDSMQKVGLSAETLSFIKYQAELSGSSLNAFTQGFAQLEKRMVDGTKKSATAFQAMGIDIKQGIEKPEAAFSKFLERFNAMPDSARKTAIAMDLFGKAGDDLIPTFASLGTSFDLAKQKAEILGLTFSTEMAEKADASGDAMDEFGLIVAGVGNRFIAEFSDQIVAGMQAAGTATISATGIIIEQLKEIGAGTDITVEGVIKGIGKIAAQAIPAFSYVGLGIEGFVASFGTWIHYVLTLGSQSIQWLANTTIGAINNLIGAANQFGADWKPIELFSFGDRAKADSDMLFQEINNIRARQLKAWDEIGNAGIRYENKYLELSKQRVDVDAKMIKNREEAEKRLKSLGGGDIDTAKSKAKEVREKSKSEMPKDLWRWQDIAEFARQKGFTVTSTTSGGHNKGSNHYRGLAVDVRTRDKSLQEIADFMAFARKSGLYVKDERTRPAGQKVWGGPHLHLQDARLTKTGKVASKVYRALNDDDDRDLIREDNLLFQKEKLEKIKGFYERMKSEAVPEKFVKEYADFLNQSIKVDREKLDVETVREKYFKRTSSPVSDAGAGSITQPIDLRKNLDQEYIANLRESLGLTAEVAEKTRYGMLFLRERNKESEIGIRLEDEALKMREDMLDLDIQMQVFRRQNADNQFSEQRRLLSQKREQFDLEKEIVNLQDEIAVGSANDNLKIQAAHLKDILDLRQRELDATISINRAELELSQSMSISTNLIRARVMEHLASQRTLNEAVADGIIGTYEVLSKQAGAALDKLNEKTKGFLSFIIEPAKAMQQNIFTNLTKNLLDKFLPGMSEITSQTSNPVAKPITEKLSKTNSLLQEIAVNTRIGGAGSGSGIGSIGGIGGGSASSIISRILGIGGGENLSAGAGSLMNSVTFRDGSTYTAGASRPRIVDGMPITQNGSSGGFFGNLKNLFSTNQGGLFAPTQNVLTGQTSSLAGKMAGAGAIASLVGGFLPGKLGSVVSMTGTGMSMGAMFGPWGAAAGAVIGGLIGLFGGDPKRKQDKKENLPKLQQGFADAFNQFQQLISDVKRFQNVDGALAKATELRNQIASGFGITFASKKYRKESQSLIAAKLKEIDRIDQNPLQGGLMQQLKYYVERANSAAEIQKAIIPEFATGAFMSSAFAAQYKDFKRRNGFLGGTFTGRDTLPSMLAEGEMVLNPYQIRAVIQNAGRDPFVNASIPNYKGQPARFADGGYIGNNSPTASGSANRSSEKEQIVVNNYYEVRISEQEFSEVILKTTQSDDSKRILFKTINEGKKQNKI